MSKANPDPKYARQRAHYAANEDRAAELQRKRLSDPQKRDQKNATYRAWRSRNVEKLNARERERYAQNPRRLTQQIMRSTERRHARQDAVNKIKMERGCERCGFKVHPIALHFDHINPEEKSHDICKMIAQNKTLDAILDEIKKCRVLCANCHAIKTVEDGDYLRYRNRKRAEKGLPPVKIDNPQLRLFPEA